MWRISALLRRQEAGFSYLMVMIAVTLMGLILTMAARQWKTLVQRELEADLLAKGIEIQTALALYSASAKAGRVMPGEVYPQTLVELTRPPKPFLRKVYLDPVGHGEWELLRAPTGGIMGVRSKSRHTPIKQGEFPPDVRHFRGKPTHYDWVFQYPNPSMAAVTGSITGSLPVRDQPAVTEQSMVQGEPASESMDAPGHATDPTDSLPPMDPSLTQEPAGLPSPETIP